MNKIKVIGVICAIAVLNAGLAYVVSSDYFLLVIVWCVVSGGVGGKLAYDWWGWE